MEIRGIVKLVKLMSLLVKNENLSNVRKSKKLTKLDLTKNKR